MKVKVCHITTVHPSDDVRIFHKECTSLAAFGFDVTLLILNAKSDSKNGVQIKGVPYPFKNRFHRIYKAPKVALLAALQLNADVYHFHDPELLRIATALKKAGKKVIYDVHEDVPRQIIGKYWIPKLFRIPISNVFEFYENRIAAKLDGIITATPFIRDRFLKINSNTIDINNFPILEEFDMNQEPNYSSKQVCYIGGIETVRGIKEMIDALEFTPYSLTLAGKFSSMALEQEMKAKQQWYKVDFKGFLNRAEIKNTLQQSMAGLVTLHPIINYIDALPVKMFEYMAAGIPVIASDFPLWRSIVSESHCGTVVDPLNPKAIAAAITFYIEHPHIAKEQGANGKNAIRTKYNWNVEKEKLFQFYKKIIYPKN